MIYVKRRWNGSTYSFPALIDINADLVCPGIHTIIGSSGSGKSTFLKILAGIEPKLSGIIHSTSESLADNSAYIDQHFYMSYGPELTLSTLKQTIYPMSDAFCELLDSVNIPMSQPAQSLLESDRRIFEILIALSRVVCQHEAVLCLDEYFDKDCRSSLQKLSTFLNYASSLPKLRLQIFIITHSKKVLNQFNKNIIVFNKGRIYSQTKEMSNDRILPNQLLTDMID